MRPNRRFERCALGTSRQGRRYVASGFNRSRGTRGVHAEHARGSAKNAAETAAVPGRAHPEIGYWRANTALGPPRQRVECFFRLAAEGETDRLVPFVLSTCREEGSVVEMSVRENLVVVRLGGAGGVTVADLSAAQALSESRWANAAAAISA